MTSSSHLIPEQRQQLILQLLQRETVMSTRQLTEALEVSHMTVRRDIAALEAAGSVVAVQGGVRLPDAIKGEPPKERAARSHLEVASKKAIARAAGRHVRDGMTIFLDAGTTCEAVVPELANHRDLTVVTSDFHSVTLLASHSTHEVIHTGGTLDRERSAATGSLAAATVNRLGIDLYLMSTGSWNLTHGVTVPVGATVLLKQAALAAARQTLLLADSTKYGSFERFRVIPLHLLGGIVTDARLSTTDLDQLHDAGCRVELVS